jgi:peptidoglycan/LPS O-acetylase OafA/YrhL
MSPAGLGEPPQAHLREDGALARDAVGQDDIEGGEPVVATSSRASPRSKISRTLPEARCGNGSPSFPGTDLALALSYTANWAQALFGYYMTWLNHCWSLAIEEQFYLIWPLVILAVERVGRSLAAKAGLLLAGAAGVAVYRAWHVGVWTDERINFGLDTRMDSLMTGAALAYVVQAVAEWRARVPAGRGDVVSERPAGTQALQSKVLGWFLAPFALATLFTIPQIVTWYSPWMGWIGYVLVAGLAAVVLADLVLGRHSLLAPVLATRPMVFVGKISYGLYLLHLPVYFAVEKIIPAAPLALRLGCKVTVSLTLATMSYYWVERRFLRLKDRFEG